MSAPIAIINRNLVRRISLSLRNTSWRKPPPCLHCYKPLLATSSCRAVDRRLYCVDKNKDGVNAQSQSIDGRPESQPIGQQGVNEQNVETDQKEEREEREREEEYEFGVRERILSASLKHVLDYGWSQQAIEAGARDEGLSEAANGMFEKGGADLVSHFYKKCNRDLVEHLKLEVERLKEDGQVKPSTTEFIKNAVETRLRMVIPYHSSWKEAMAIQTMPQNAPESWKNLSDLCDDIWYYAGDRSTDFDWYTKRLSLAAVYKATEIYMLQDSSEDFANTWSFLANRVNNLETMGSLRKSLAPLADSVIGLIKMGRNILGMNSRNR